MFGNKNNSRNYLQESDMASFNAECNFSRKRRGNLFKQSQAVVGLWLSCPPFQKHIYRPVNLQPVFPVTQWHMWGLVIQCIYRDLCGYPQCMTGDLAKVLDCLIPTLNMCLEFQPSMPSWWDSGITFFHNCPARWAVSREVTLLLSPVFLIGAGIQDGSREEDDVRWVTSPYQAPCWCVPSVCPV